MLDRVEAICYSLGDYVFNNPHAKAGFRSQDRKYIPGPVVLVSESLVAGIAPPGCKKQVENVLSMVSGWKSGPDKVLTVMIEAAETWRVVEAPERRKGDSKVTAQGNDSNAAGKAKEQTEKEDLQVSVAQQWKQAEIIVPGGEGHRSHCAKTVLEGGADISSIPGSVWILLELDGMVSRFDLRCQRVLGMYVLRTVEWLASRESQYPRGWNFKLSGGPSRWSRGCSR